MCFSNVRFIRAAIFLCILFSRDVCAMGLDLSGITFSEEENEKKNATENRVKKSKGSSPDKASFRDKKDEKKNIDEDKIEKSGELDLSGVTFFDEEDTKKSTRKSHKKYEEKYEEKSNDEFMPNLKKAYELVKAAKES